MARNDWKRLASYVRQRRIALGYRTRRVFAAEIGWTDRTLGTLESGQPVGRDTLAAVELGLHWAPGSAERVRDGGEPELWPDPLTGPAEPTETGRFDDPEEQRIWDAMTTGGVTIEDRLFVIESRRVRERMRRHGREAAE